MFALPHRQQAPCSKCWNASAAARGATRIWTTLKLAGVIKRHFPMRPRQTSPNPVLSTMEHFADEYHAHIALRQCPAGQCKELRMYYINPDNAPDVRPAPGFAPFAQRLEGERKMPHEIDIEKCITLRGLRRQV